MRAARDSFWIALLPSYVYSPHRSPSTAPPQEPLLRATSSEALQCEWLNRSRASSDLRTPTPGARKTVAKAVQQRKVQLPVETERWEERRHLEFR